MKRLINKDIKTVYCFYLIDCYDNQDDYPGIISDTIEYVNDRSAYTLYAFTDNKEYAKEFRATRSRDIFREKRITISGLDFENMLENMSGYILENHQVKTKVRKHGNTYLGICELLCTSAEFDAITVLQDYYVRELLSDSFNTIFDIVMHQFVKDDLLKVLEIFFGIDDFVYDQVYPYEMMSSRINVKDIDELELFILLFKNTFQECHN